LAVIILAILFLGWYLWFRFKLFREKMKKEVGEIESTLHKAFNLLKNDINDQVKLLEKTRTRRQLTEEEERIIKQLKKDLDSIERLVKKEIEDVEEELK
jgi:copper homeostasis protein CutC